MPISAQVALEHAPPSDKLYGNPLFGIQATGNSNSIRAFWKPLRTAGAAARAMLVQAAAQQWQVDPASCTASNGEVTHAASGRKLAYGDLADAASQLPVAAKDPPLKDPKDFVLIGKPLKRLDTPDKINGKVVYGIDAMLPGMKFATLAACPVFGGKVGHVDDSAAKNVPGVRKIVVLDDLVAVVGDHMWAAKKGLDALDINWDEGPNADVSSERYLGGPARRKQKGRRGREIRRRCRQGPCRRARDSRPTTNCRSSRMRPMEPMNCTVQLTPGACEIWTGTQVMTRVQRTAAQGGRASARESDRAQSSARRRFRPQARSRHGGRAPCASRKHVDGAGQGGLDARRRHPARCLSPGLSRHDCREPVGRQDRRLEISRHRLVDHGALVSAGVPERHRHRRASIAPSTFPTTFPISTSNMCAPSRPRCRPASGAASGPNNNVFAIECFMDELARKAGKDPVAFRRGMLGKHAAACRPRSNLAAEKSGWGQPLPARVGRGVCVQPSFASFIATVVEAEVDDNGEVHLRRVTSAVDTGIAVNPDTIVAQLQGGLIFGLTAALYGEITIDKGRVQQSNFNDYRMLRIDQAPKIEVHVIKSGEAPGGIGETGATAGPPALRNAIYRRDRRRAAPPADRPRRDRGEETRHERPARIACSSALPSSSAIVVCVGVARLWIVLGPGPMAFAGGATVALADYQGRRSHRRSGLACQGASLVERGEYLARAADCVACHTAPGRQGLMPAASPSRCRSARSIRPTSRPTRTPASATTATQRFPERGATRHPPRRRAALSGDAVSRPTPT